MFWSGKVREIKERVRQRWLIFSIRVIHHFWWVNVVVEFEWVKDGRIDVFVTRCMVNNVVPERSIKFFIFPISFHILRLLGKVKLRRVYTLCEWSYYYIRYHRDLDFYDKYIANIHERVLERIRREREWELENGVVYKDSGEEDIDLSELEVVDEIL